MYNKYAQKNENIAFCQIRYTKADGTVEIEVYQEARLGEDTQISSFMDDYDDDKEIVEEETESSPDELLEIEKKHKQLRSALERLFKSMTRFQGWQ